MSSEERAVADGDVVLDLGQAVRNVASTFQGLLAFISYIVVIGFRWDQGFIGAVVDSISIAIAIKLFRKFYHWRAPEFSRFFPQYRLSLEEGRRLTEQHRIDLYQLLARWPRVCASQMFLLNVLKSIPVNILALFVFDRYYSFPLHAALYLGIQALLMAYHVGLVFVSAHDEVSRFFARVHERDDWSTTFQKVETKDEDISSFQNFERLSLSAIVLLLGLSLTGVLYGREWESAGQEVMSVLLLLAFAASLVAQVVEIQRRVLVGGMLRIFRSLANLEARGDRRRLPYSSWSLLASFEAGFNRLLNRLDEREREVGHWISRTAEDSRLTTMGEMASLVIHDIGNPLQMAQFCAASLKRASDPELRKKLEGELDASIERLTSLTQALRARVEGRQNSLSGTRLGSIHAQVCQFLDLQLKQEGFVSDRWVKADPRIHRVNLQASQADLFQIIENLYRNSFRALVRVGSSNPVIGIRIGEAHAPGLVALEFFDNGPGLSPERFEQLTSDGWVSASDTQSRPPAERGLGLRLTRKLVASLGGTMKVVVESPDRPSAGALVIVTLPATVASDESEAIYV